MTSIKEQAEVYKNTNHGDWKFYKTLPKYVILQNEEYDNVVKSIKCVKNAVCFIKDDIFKCKHYDTIIFEYDLKQDRIITLGLDYSQTSNKMIYSCMEFVGFGYENDGNIWELMSKHATSQEPSQRNNGYTYGIFERV